MLVIPWDFTLTALALSLVGEEGSVKNTLLENTFCGLEDLILWGRKELSIFLAKLIMSATSFCLHVLSAWFQILSFPTGLREKRKILPK